MVLRIPYAEIEIADGWFVADLVTVEDCDEALVQLARDIAAIGAEIDKNTGDLERAVAIYELAPPATSARIALKVKREVYQLVTKRRVEIVVARKHARADRYDRKLLDLLKARAPDVFAAAVAEVGEVA